MDNARANSAAGGPLADEGRVRPQGSHWTLAWLDLVEAIGQYWFWVRLGWNDIVQRYRGSILGPFWLTVTTSVFIAGLGPLYAGLFNLDPMKYLPFMAMGVLTWNFVTGTISEGCRAFVDGGSLLKQMRLPRMTLMLHILWRNIIVFLHNLPVFAALILICGIPLQWSMLWAIPGFALVCLNLLWITLLLAIVCLRYRDMIQIVNSVLLLGFFFTPVMWNPKLQKVNAWVVNANPFASFLEVVRAPLMGDAVSGPLLAMALVLPLFGGALAAWAFARYRKQIIYWV